VSGGPASGGDGRSGTGRGAGDRPGVSMVPPAEFRSYYGRPILKAPVWTDEVPAYFFAGGLAGASASLALGARLAGNHRLASGALTASAAGILASFPLLVHDLGRPERFHHMLRVFKPTSPMNLGSWLLSTAGPAVVGAAVADRLGILPRAGRAAEVVAGVLGPAVATYTGVLVADTAVPVWHEAGDQLPLVFAAGAAASAGAAATLLTPAADAGPARRLAVGGALADLVTVEVMRRQLGDLGTPYQQPPARRFANLARGFMAAGALTVGLGGRHRAAAVAGGALILAGAACQRFAVHKAGILSAADPAYVVGPQRERLAAGHGQPGTG
jgi:Polysulphide reductase, NrfD